RIQVEHPVTEAVTGQDIVAWQLRLASGEALPAELDRLEPRGHAIECRLCAERPPEHTPSSGRLLVFEPPSTPWVRFDTGYRQGDDVSVAFDSLLGKAVTWGPDRKTALRRMDLALETTVVLGIETNADFLRDALRHPTFQAGSYTTSFLEGEMGRWRPPEAPAEVAAIAAGALERSARRASGREAARAAGPWDAIRGPFFEARSP
ncbi:MAG: hypothetical protein HY721_28930, partial [Planctomycetes bacterium]|nr:hypothetical protein [Planctomycetota bacterium]